MTQKKGYKFLEEHKKKISENRMGKGKIERKILICPCCQKEFEVKITSNRKYCCRSCASKSYIFSKEHCQKISGSKKGWKPSEERNKKLKESLNKPEVIRKQIESHIGKRPSKETIQRMKKSQNKPEVKLRRREITLINMKNNGNKFPGYNKNTIPIFQKFDELNNTKGIYATNPYEHQILGYSLDYFNLNLKLIIEIDEKLHKYKRSKDLQRQQEIQNFYPDFKFLRFEDHKMDEILELKLGVSNE